MRAPCLFALLVAAAVTAGCLKGAEPTPVPEPGVGGGVAWALGPPVTALAECTRSCSEPSVAWDAAGRLLATAADGSAIAVSEDGGATWTQQPPPPIVAGALDAPPQGLAGVAVSADALLQADSAGRTYFSTLVIGLDAIQVAWTEDGAASWGSNALVRVPNPGAGGPTVVPDRQWLGFGADGTVYLAYNQPPTGIWVARSDDGGATFEPFVLAAPTSGRGTFGLHGPPLVDDSGRVLFPAFSVGRGDGTPTEVRLYASEDRGATWSTIPVAASAGDYFPIAAVGSDGVLHVAWKTTGSPRVQAASSRDGGASWSEPSTWSAEGAQAYSSPWAAAGPDGALTVAWFESGIDLVVARAASADAPIASATAVSGLDAFGTDFAHAAIAPDGRLAVTWVDASDAVQVRVAPRS